MIREKGFSLIELMIVVGIIGILSMIAMPFYRDHMKRLAVAEAIQLSSVIHNYIVEFHAINGRYPHSPGYQGSQELPFKAVRRAYGGGDVSDKYLIELDLSSNASKYVDGYLYLGHDRLEFEERPLVMMYIIFKTEFEAPLPGKAPREIPLLYSVDDNGSTRLLCGHNAAVKLGNIVSSKYLPSACKLKS